MREIKFRGKRIDNGEWVYGYLLEKWTAINNHKKYAIDKCMTFSENGWDSLDVYEVTSETVGQYAGLKDKNGKEIYEGDIINDGDNNLMVKFSNYFLGYFVWVGYGGFIEKPLYDIPLIEVVGNIHQNPELLEGK